ncbi:MAG: sigma-70 family RNA polymerase sigma factor [Bacteroidota bacterium]
MKSFRTKTNLSLKKSDLNILKACIKGDTKAQTQLYRKHKAMLFGVCLRYAKDRIEAEDFMQEGLIVIFRDLKQYRPTSALGAWMRRVMINVCLQQLRKRHNVFKVSSMEAKEVLMLQSAEDILGNLRAKELIQMVQSLPVGYRAVFNLYVIEGYSHKEIAELLNISMNTSKSQLSRAKANLRKLLEAELIG